MSSRRPEGLVFEGHKKTPSSIGRNAYGDYVPGAMIGNALNNITIYRHQIKGFNPENLALTHPFRPIMIKLFVYGFV